MLLVAGIDAGPAVMSLKFGFDYDASYALCYGDRECVKTNMKRWATAVNSMTRQSMDLVVQIEDVIMDEDLNAGYSHNPVARLKYFPRAWANVKIAHDFDFFILFTAFTNFLDQKSFIAT